MSGGDAATVASRCGALLRGGVAPQRVFEVLAEEASGDGAVDSVAGRFARGFPVPEALAALDEPSWRVLAAAWQLGEASGSPLAPTLERIAASLQAVEQLRERRSVLLAGSRATVRMVAALPPLALLLGWALGFDAILVLLSPLGLVLLIVGASLLLAGVQWARLMTRAVERADRPAGIELELLWVALGGGSPPSTARVRVVDCVDRLGVEWAGFDAFLREGPIASAIRTSEALGVPLRPLLLEEAAAARVRAHSELERASERLGIRVLIPLGLCVLPSFIVLGVVPVLVAMLGGAGI